MANEEIKFQLGAEDTGVQAELRKVSAAVSTASAEIQSKFAGVSDVFAKVQGAFLAFTAVLAGGKLFKDAISSSVEMEKSAAALGKQLGISATDASVLAIALDDAHISQETFTAASSKIAVALEKNEEAFKNLGVKTRDQNGNFRNQLDIMKDVNAALLKFKEGTDRNVEGIKIYGKAWGEVAPSLKLVQKGIDDAKVKADALGLTVGVENVAAVNRYRDAMNDVGDVTHGYQRAVADQLLPVLSDLGEWFAARGPQDIGFFREALLKITIAIREIASAVRIVFDVLSGVGQQFVILGTTISKYFGEMMLGNFSKAGDVLAEGWKRYMDAGRNAIGAVKKDWDALQLGITDSFEAAYSKQTPTAPPKPGDHSKGGTNTSKVGEFTTKLEELKAAYSEQQRIEGSFREFSKDQEKSYWANILQTQKLSTADSLEVRRKIATASLAIDKQVFEAQLAGLQAQEAEFANDFDQKLAIAHEFADRVKTAYGTDSKNYQEAQKHIIEIERAKQAQILAIREIAAGTLRSMALAEVDAQEQAAQLSEALGETTYAQLLDKERQFEDARNQIQLSALQEKFAIYAQDPFTNVEKLAAINAQIEELELAHQGRMQQIQAATTIESRKNWTSLFQGMQSGFQSVLANFLKGTATFGQTVRGLFVSVLDAITNTLAQMAATWAVQQLQQLITGKTTSVSLIAGSAAQAGAAAVASTAAIPIIGPALAPAAGLAAYGAAIAYEGLNAAEQGFDVPGGVNPITQLHQREMVLPAKYADVIRGLESGSGGGSGHTTVNLHIKTHDAGSFAKSLNDNSSEVARALKKHLKGTGRLVPSY